MKKLVFMLSLIFVLGILLAAQAPGINKKEPVLTEYPGFWYACMDFKGPYETMREKLTIFKAEFEKQGLTALGDIVAVYYNPPKLNKKEDLEWSISYPVSPDAEVKAPLRKVEFKTTQCVVLIFADFPGPIQPANDKVDAFIDDNGLVTVWPAYEVFQREPRQIIIIHPVAKKESVKK